MLIEKENNTNSMNGRKRWAFLILWNSLQVCANLTISLIGLKLQSEGIIPLMGILSIRSSASAEETERIRQMLPVC